MTYLPLAVVVGAADLGQTAPAFTQAERSATSESFNLPPIGILRLGSVCRTADMSRLLSGSPGVIAGPRVPPLSIASALSRRRSPSFELVWQEKQLFARIGRIFDSKKSPEAASGACARRKVAGPR